MAQALQVALNGVTLASLYFLIASGLTLIFGLMRIINLAHGTNYLLGGYLGYAVATTTGSWLLGAATGAIAIGVFGLIIYHGLIRRFQHDDMRVALITLGIAIIGTDLMMAGFGGLAREVPTEVNVKVGVPLPLVGNYQLSRLLVLAIAVIVGIALTLFINRTRFGSRVRAGIDDSQMTSASGVNVTVVFTIIFVLGSALAGFAGVVGGTLFPLQPGQDGTYLLFSLVVVIVGGMGSIAGAAIGALLVGLVSQFSLLYIPSYALVLTFALMVAVLIFRPQGILGRSA